MYKDTTNKVIEYALPCADSTKKLLILNHGKSISNDKRNCKKLPNINYEFPLIVPNNHLYHKDYPKLHT